MTIIRQAQPEDTKAIAALLEDLDRFYGSTDFAPLTDRTRELSNVLFSTQPAAYVLLAETDSRPVGFAAYSFLWPAVGLTASLYLKELYVRDTSRGQGIGRQLVAALLQLAKEAGCSRVDWTTDRDNQAAQAFYARLGHDPEPSKLFYRVALD